MRLCSKYPAMQIDQLGVDVVRQGQVEVFESLSQEKGLHRVEKGTGDIDIRNGRERRISFAMGLNPFQNLRGAVAPFHVACDLKSSK
jgi:hypothetical protein